MTWKPGQKEAFKHEIDAALSARARGDARAEFSHLERAHILGQRSTFAHTLAHWRMLRFGLRHRNLREVAGQVARVFAALTKSMIWVPVGNSGGTNVSPFRRMPVPSDLRVFLD